MEHETHEGMIGAVWFTREKLERLFPGYDLRDKISSGYADGGYGGNVLEKIQAGANTPARQEAARKLAHSLLEDSGACPVCSK